MNKSRFSPAVIVSIALLIIAGISLYIRIALPYDQVFVNGTVWFRENDTYYHMRLVDNLIHHFPQRISFDPYTFYPHGTTVPWPPFFDWLVAGIAWLIGLGSPTPHTVDVVGAYLPAILGTLTIIPVYFIGKELLNRWVGVLAAALVAILPGEFLNRSLLGFTDHHVAESLFTTVTILFLILAVKSARARGISFVNLLNKNWSIIAKPLIYTLLAGLFLGIYLLTWTGGLLLVFIISAWLIIQFIIEHLKGKSTDYLCIIGTPSFLIAFLMFLPAMGNGELETIYRISLIFAIIMPLALVGISRLMATKAVKPVFYPLALAALAGIGFALFYAINPSLLHSMLGKFSIFTPGGAALTILEVHPLLLPYGNFSLQIAWLNFTTAFFISFISLGWLIYLNIKEESADKTLFLVWSLVMLIAVLGQRRFGYYYAINAALLTGYFAWRILDFAGLTQLLARPKEAIKAYTQTKKAKKMKKTEARAVEKAARERRTAWVKVIVAAVVVFFLVYFPNIGRAKALAQEPSLINQPWYESIEWLKDNSPEPFGDPNSYYELYQPPLQGKDYQYPETAYSIMSWWDYGHWITRIAHRIPVSNPFQGGASEAARFFTAQDEGSANKELDSLGSRYVIIDYQMPTAKFYAMPQFIGGSPDEFYGTYYVLQEGGKLQQVPFFYPSYYCSSVVRLYNFDGKAAAPSQNSTIVLSWEWKTSKEGVQYKQVLNSWAFPGYEEAKNYVSSQKSGQYVIGNTDPFVTPVPLAEMQHYKLVYASPQKWQDKPAVKIFEYVK